MNDTKITLSVVAENKRDAFGKLRAAITEVQTITHSANVFEGESNGVDVSLRTEPFRHSFSEFAETYSTFPTFARRLHDFEFEISEKEIAEGRRRVDAIITDAMESMTDAEYATIKASRAKEFFPYEDLAQALFPSMLTIHESEDAISEGIPAFVSIADGNDVIGFSGEQIVTCIREHGGTETEFNPQVAQWLWDGNAAQGQAEQNVEDMAGCTAKHWAFRKWAEGTSFKTPDTLGAARYVQEELGEVCRIFSMISRPDDARRKRKKFTDHDLFSELADLWLMLDTAQKQIPCTDHFAGDFIGDPLLDIQVCTNRAINVILTVGNDSANETFVANHLHTAKLAICRYPGFDLNVYTAQRLYDWKGRAK